MADDHERIWLEPHSEETDRRGRGWCASPHHIEAGTEYVRTDLYAALTAEVARLREALAAIDMAYLAGCYAHDDKGHPYEGSALQQLVKQALSSPSSERWRAEQRVIEAARQYRKIEWEDWAADAIRVARADRDEIAHMIELVEAVDALAALSASGPHT